MSDDRPKDGPEAFFDARRRLETRKAYRILLDWQGRLRGYLAVRYGAEVRSSAEIEVLVRESTWKAASCKEPEPEHPGAVALWAFEIGVNHALHFLRDERDRRRRNGTLPADPVRDPAAARELEAVLERLTAAERLILELDLESGGLASLAALEQRLGQPPSALLEQRSAARRAIAGSAPNPLVSWYELVRRLGRSASLRPLEPLEARAEFGETPERPPLEMPPSYALGTQMTQTMVTLSLLERVRGGDDRGWDELYRRYQKMLAGHVAVNLNRRLAPADREAMIQQALERVWAKIREYEYRGEGSFRAWLATVVLNAVKNIFASRDRERDRRESVQDSDLNRIPAREANSDDQAALLDALSRLDEADCELLRMRYFEELSFECIADVLECSRESARQRFLGARDRLRRLLGLQPPAKDDGEDDGDCAGPVPIP